MLNRLYDPFHINFSSSIPRSLLEDFAAQSAEGAAQVSQVYDQYLNFVSLENNLFSLQLPLAYITLNDPTTAESKLEKLTDQIAFAIFSVLITLSTLFTNFRESADYQVSKRQCNGSYCNET